MTPTVFCGECGAKIEAGSGFCGECGTKVEGPVAAAPPAAAPPAAEPPSKKKVRAASSPMPPPAPPIEARPTQPIPRLCEHCGTSIRPGAVFCRHCGAGVQGGRGPVDLGASAAAVPLQRTPPPPPTAPAAAAPARRGPGAVKKLLGVAAPIASMLVTYYVTNKFAGSNLTQIAGLPPQMLPMVISMAVGGAIRWLINR